jgi:hypothetical protein
MPEPTDQELLAHYAHTASETAFAALVNRHLNSDFGDSGIRIFRRRDCRRSRLGKLPKPAMLVAVR